MKEEQFRFLIANIFLLGVFLAHGAFNSTLLFILSIIWFIAGMKA
jgi:hypothetical protein